MELIGAAKRDHGFKAGERPAHFDPTRTANRHNAARRASEVHSFYLGDSYRELHDYLESVVINLALRQSYTSAGTETPAFLVFMTCYVAAAILTWTRYVGPQQRSQSAATPGWDGLAGQPVSS
jgi:hypothetical protein